MSVDGAPATGRTTGPGPGAPGPVVAPTAQRPAARTPWWRPSRWLPVVVALALVAVVWTAVAAGNPFVLPRLPAVAGALLASPATYLANAATTLQVALAGLAVGFTAAVALAVVMSEVAVVRRALLPLAVVLNVTPVVALAPGLVVAFGFGATPKVLLTAIIVFFPVLVNTTTGLRSVPPATLEVFTSLRASRLETLVRLRLPTSLPYVLAALRVVLPLSLVGAVVAEFVAAGSSAGLGTLIRNTAATSQLPAMYAAVACLAAMGLALLVLVGALDRRLLHWHDSRAPRP